MAYIVGIDRNQTRMVTTSLDALIDEDNSVRVIDAYVDSLDLIELGFKEYSGTNRGQAPYRRSDLLKLHIYGYLNKIRSSRSLEIECKRNLELMWLINAITPDHGTIAGFVKNNRKAFHVTLRNLTLILKGWGLIDGKLIAIDGTKIRAQNSKHNCITKSGLDKKIAYADEQINAYLMALEKDSQCEPEFKKKLEDYQELKKQYHQQKQALSNEGLEQKSLTDPDSRRMKNNGSLDICYNVQSAVDAQNHFVIDISTTNDINDQNQLYIMAKDASDLLETEECTVVVREFLKHKNDDRYKRAMIVLIELIDKETKYFPELTKREANIWLIREIRDADEMIEINAYLGMLRNHLRRKEILCF